MKEFLSVIAVIFCPLSCGDFLSSTSLITTIINVVSNTFPLSISCIKRRPNNLTTYTKYSIFVWYRSSRPLAKSLARPFLFLRISLLLRIALAHIGYRVVHTQDFHLPSILSSSLSPSSLSSVSGETSLSASGSPKSWLKRCLAHTMQWIGSEGVLRIVQPGNVLAAGLG